MSAPARPTAAPISRLLRSELSLVVPRLRTVITLATLLVIPLLTAFGLRSVGGERSTVLGVALVSTTEFTALPLAVPVVLVAADAFAAERSHRTLDQLRLAPVSAGRLVALKSAGVLAAALLAALVTTAAALLGGLALLPLGPYSTGATLGREVVIWLWLSGQLAGFGMLLLPLSMLIRRTTGVVAVGLAPPALGVLLPAGPGWLAAVAPSGNWMVTTTAISSVPVGWADVGATTARAGVYVLLGAGLTAWLLARRDG